MNKIAFFFCLSVAAPMVARAQSDSTFSWSKRLPDGAQLTIRNLNGPIDVRSTPGAQVQVHATVRAEGRANVRDAGFDVREHSATDVEICSVYLGSSACDRQHNDSWNNIRVTVRYTVDLPKGLQLTLNTGNGELSITGATGDVDGATGNGDVTVKETIGRVSARTGNGDVTVTGAQGPVKIGTGNGRVTAETSRGPVDVSSGNGDIEVRVGAVPADATSMTFTTGSGNVRITLPRDFNGEIDATAGSGDITSDFDVRATGRITPSRLHGTVGTGHGPLIKLGTGSGQLVLRKG